jgi:hypothetical protein
MGMEPSSNETSWHEISTDGDVGRWDEVDREESSVGCRSGEQQSEFFLKLERGEFLK